MKLPPHRSPLSIALTAAVVAQLHVLSAFANNADSADDSIPWLSLLLPTLLLGAAVAATLVVRRWKGAVGGRDGPLQLVHVIALGPRERLALVKVGTHFLVVGITPGSVNRVAELYDIQHADSSQPPIQTGGDPDL
jgi:flagellar biogenesis protein FliO